MKINKNFIEKCSYFYILIPVLIFLLGWIKPIIAISLLIGFILVFLKISREIEFSFYELSKKEFLIVLSIIIFWCIFSGIGHLYYQSHDWHIRNAVFRDLINFSFPVLYDNDSTLIYYFQYFLPAAIFGKIIGLTGLNQEIVFRLAHLFHLFWVVLGIVLVFLNIGNFLKREDVLKHSIVLFLMFVFFSGMDILLPGNTFEQFHIEWHWQWQFSSNTTLMFWVHNQVVVPWLCTILLINNVQKIEKFGLIILPCMCCGPFPFIGLVIYVIAFLLQGLIEKIKEKEVILFFKKIFSLENILSFVFMVILYFFYETNSSLTNNNIVFDGINLKLIYFFVAEVGVLFLLLTKDNCKNNLFYITLFSLILLPMFWFGYAPDICMRASIPGLFVLFCLTAKTLFKAKGFIRIFIMVVLLLGSITPLIEFYRSFVYIFYLQKRPIVSDEIKTLNNRILDINKPQLIVFSDKTDNYCSFGNYGTKNYSDKIFFKYLAKKFKK